MQKHAKKKPSKPTKPKKAPLPLRGVTLVLDPGHGGSDPGAVRGVTEAALSYRMALTVAVCAKQAGAKVYFTVRSAALRARLRDPRHEPPLISPTDATSPLDPGHVVGAGREDARELHRRARVAAIHWARAKPRVLFVALHFDADLAQIHSGGHVIYDSRMSPRPPRLALAIVQQFARHGLCGDRAPLPVGRDLGVLNPEFNPVPGAVLVELATLSNPADHRRALDPVWRWHVARLLTSAFIISRP